jgi:hypothetical protein
VHIKKRIVLGAALGTTVFGSVFGLAAGLNVYSGEQLGSGAAEVTSCDVDGVVTTYQYNGESDYVSGVEIHGISNGCDDATAYVRTSDKYGDGFSTGSATVTTEWGGGDDNLVVVQLDEPIRAEFLEHVGVTLEGGHVPEYVELQN